MVNFNINKFDIILVGMFLIFIAIVITALTIIKMEGTKCMVNPIIYGIQGLEENYKKQVSCTCSVADPKFSPVLITSNGTIVLNSGDFLNITNFSFISHY